MAANERFIHRSRQYLTANYLPKIRVAVGALTEDDVWWRPNPTSNSVGHLLLHLAGNVRQWICTGLGGAPNTRRRELEFAPQTVPTKGELLTGLSEAVADADAVLAALDPATLEDRVEIQGLTVTRLGALYHVVEHFSMHTGQIIYIAKARTGRDFTFYRVSDGKAQPNWPGETGEP